MKFRLPFLVLLAVALVVSGRAFALQKDKAALTKTVDNGPAKGADRLKSKYNKAEAEAAALAEKLRRNSVSDDDASMKLRDQLREKVASVFELRQSLRRGEIAAARAKLDIVSDELKRRDRAAKQIIDDRVAALLKQPSEGSVQPAVASQNDDAAASGDGARAARMADLLRSEEETLAELARLRQSYREFRDNSPLLTNGQEDVHFKRLAAIEELRTAMRLECTTIEANIATLTALQKRGDSSEKAKNAVKHILGSDVVDKVGDLATNLGGLKDKLKSRQATLDRIMKEFDVEEKSARAIAELVRRDEEYRSEIDRLENRVNQVQSAMIGLASSAGQPAPGPQLANLQSANGRSQKADASQISSDPMVMELLSEEADLKAKLGKDHPRLVALQQRIAVVRKQKAAEAHQESQSSMQQLMQVITELKTNVISLLDKQQQEYREFRKNTPLINFPKGKNPVADRAREYRKEKTALELELLSVSVWYEELSDMVELTKKFNGAKLDELQTQQRQKVFAIMGDKLIDATGDPQENLAGVAAKHKLLATKLKRLTAELAEMDLQAKMLREFELQDEEYRQGIAKRQKLYDTLSEKLDAIDLQQDYRQ